MSEESSELQFCEATIHSIMEERPNEIADILKRLGLFHYDNAVLLTLYSYGYCIGSLEFSLSNFFNFDYTRVDRILERMNLLFDQYVRQNLVLPNVSPASLDTSMKEIFLENNLQSEMVIYYLSENASDCFGMITADFLSSLNIPDFAIENPEDMKSCIISVRRMLDFSDLSLPDL